MIIYSHGCVRGRWICCTAVGSNNRTQQFSEKLQTTCSDPATTRANTALPQPPAEAGNAGLVTPSSDTGGLEAQRFGQPLLASD